jgi:hypothetical protein
MTQHENTSAEVCPLDQCPPEIQALVRDEHQNDPSRLRPGDPLTAYVAASNATETWEVVAPGTTVTQVLARLIDVVPAA